MEHEKSIREQGRFARRLAEDIRTLLGAVPFGAEVYRSQYELERLTRLVVAVKGAEGVGKSTLLKALDDAEVALAEVSQKQLADELRAFVQQREADALLEKLNISWPGAASPADATPAAPGRLPTSPEQA